MALTCCADPPGALGFHEEEAGADDQCCSRAVFGRGQGPDTANVPLVLLHGRNRWGAASLIHVAVWPISSAAVKGQSRQWLAWDSASRLSTEACALAGYSLGVRWGAPFGAPRAKGGRSQRLLGTLAGKVLCCIIHECTRAIWS